MGEYRGKDWQISVTSVRDRMDHLYNNTDMADLHILAVDETWWWGQTVKDFTAHKLVLCASSPVFHQLFYPSENGPEVPSCVSVAQSANSSVTKIEIEGVPPIAIEALMEYCYKDRFDRSDYENGYSRNLLWRLWHAAKLFRIRHLFQLCSEALEGTMCEETVFWDLNYSLIYEEYGTEPIKKRVAAKVESLGNSLYEHSNLVWLESTAIRELLKTRFEGCSEPLVVVNNILRWALYQLDRTICEEVEGKKDAEIPIQVRLRMIKEIKEGRIKEYTAEDIQKYLERVLELVPWAEMSQKDFLVYILDSGLLTQEQLVTSCRAIMKAVVDHPERLCKSLYAIRTDPTSNLAPLDNFYITGQAKLTASVPQTNQTYPKEMTASRTNFQETAVSRTNFQETAVSRSNIQEMAAKQLNSRSENNDQLLVDNATSINKSREPHTNDNKLHESIKTPLDTPFTQNFAKQREYNSFNSNNNNSNSSEPQNVAVRSRPNIKATLESSKLRRTQEALNSANRAEKELLLVE